jgi:hypothetical protein
MSVEPWSGVMTTDVRLVQGARGRMEGARGE